VSFQRWYCSNANPVRKIPSVKRMGIVSWFMKESRSATHSMLNAAQKHFATLSKYLSMKDTKRPHMASVATVAYANALNPWNGFWPVVEAQFASIRSVTTPNNTPNTYNCIFCQCIESLSPVDLCAAAPLPVHNRSENTPPAPDATVLTKTNV